MTTEDQKVTVRLATPHDREDIYTMRHEVYATELGQHSANSEEVLRDGLDEVNHYLSASLGDQLLGFVSLTPPQADRFSIDKYFAREMLPLTFDGGLWEIRLLTVAQEFRRQEIGKLLMYAAFRVVEQRGGTHLVAIGRKEVVELYEHVGMKILGHQASCGAVDFELMAAPVEEVRRRVDSLGAVVQRLKDACEWKVAGLPFEKSSGCYHGGRFFEAIGEELDRPERAKDVISADVLDAWYAPAPRVLSRLEANLTWLLRTSPPTGSEGMTRVIARERGVDDDCVLPGAGSSDLIFLGLRHWLHPDSRVLILDPMYGEYAHVLEEVIGCEVDRLVLKKKENYDLGAQALADAVRRDYDWVFLVNPNSPTGRHLHRAALEEVLATGPATTRFWVDETYVEYAGRDQSLEGFAAGSDNVMICKSMSKVYALSGVRAGYLCGASAMIEELRPLTPPWAVSLPAQMAAITALQEEDYYRRQIERTHTLRQELSRGLKALRWDVVEGVANFLLCHLPQDGPTTGELVTACRKRSLYLRDVSNMGRNLDDRTLRIAVKDRETNVAMLEIIESTLDQLGVVKGSQEAA